MSPVAAPAQKIPAAPQPGVTTAARAVVRGPAVVAFAVPPVPSRAIARTVRTDSSRRTGRLGTRHDLDVGGCAATFDTAGRFPAAEGRTIVTAGALRWCDS